MGGTLKRTVYFIAGPPFSGKSTIGAILARKLSIPFKNLDDVIAERAGLSVHEIFNSMGEDGFRRIESMCLKELVESPGQMVVALGGGTLLSPDNLRAVLSHGVLVTLTPDTRELLSRFRSSPGRPLAPDPKALERLLEARREHYASLPGRMDTRGKSPEDVAALIAEMSCSLRMPR